MMFSVTPNIGAEANQPLRRNGIQEAMCQGKGWAGHTLKRLESSMGLRPYEIYCSILII